MVAPDSSSLMLQAWPDGSRFRFDHAEYDEQEDRLRLTMGPPSPAAARLTPEGHVLRVSVENEALCGVVVTEVRRRLERDGHLEVTLGPLQLVVLNAADVAALVTRPATRRTNRFARAA